MSFNKKEYQLDVSGHKCPIPVLRLRRLLETAKIGEIIVLNATDPMTLIDIPNYCREAGHKLLSNEEHNENIIYKIEKF